MKYKIYSIIGCANFIKFGQSGVAIVADGQDEHPQLHWPHPHGNSGSITGIL